MMTETEAALLGAAIGGSAAIIGSLVAALVTQRETQRSRAQAALDWMTGDTQRRNVGIAAIEASWKGRWRNRRFRRLATLVLCGTALYLFSWSNQKDAAHEISNLDRIMVLLLKNSEARRFPIAYREVLRSIMVNKTIDSGMSWKDRATRGHTGLFIDTQKLERWAQQLREAGVEVNDSEALA
jgi:hypothetical protein